MKVYKMPKGYSDIYKKYYKSWGNGKKDFHNTIIEFDNNNRIDTGLYSNASSFL